MKDLNLLYLAGGPIAKKQPVTPFDDAVCAFLDDLSKEIRKDPRARLYPDVASFAFYCRKANIAHLKNAYPDRQLRMGRGLAFQIAPSNVPVNFAYTYLFGLLAGNANVVRVSTKTFAQVQIICEAMNRLFEKEEYKKIREQTAIVRYERNREITDRLSVLADIRVIWGGNGTIADIRKSPLTAYGKEITFADRYSFGIFSAQAVLDASEEELTKLAGRFYNDTYLMDQNACSTPHLILWKRDTEKYDQAKKRFWQAVYRAVGKYDLADIKVSDKYVMLCRYAMQMKGLRVERYDNLLYVISLQDLPACMTALRGQFGLFFQKDVDAIDEIAPYIDRTVQSCMYYGIEKEEILRMIREKHLMGIDRVVEFGRSMDIGVVWDGYDLLREMSRMIEVDGWMRKK